jgi:hypothetical protein
MNEPLDPELKALLEAERGALPVAASLERVWSRLAVLPPGGGSGGGGSTPHAPSWLASHALGAAMATFVAGAIVGAGAHAMLQKPPPERIVYVDRPTPLAASPSPSSVTSSWAVATASPSASAAPLAHASVRAAPSASSTSSLSDERALLDRVRSELAENDPANALNLVDEHTRRFPKAQLAEEREVLAVQALVALGRYDEARTRAAKLRAASPNSLLLPAIDATLGSIP